MAISSRILGLLYIAVAISTWSAWAKNVRTATPLMGWNSYNYYNCFPNESIITENAEGLVSLGLAKLGYTYVTPDCGWDANARDADGRLRWNETLFPSGGGKVLGDFLHGLGLKFGVYSGGGYLQCGSTDLPASLGMFSSIKGSQSNSYRRIDYEIMDADTFASWGADALKSVWWPLMRLKERSR